VRLLGIDPGLRITGYGVIDKTGQQLTYVASGVVRTETGELPGRIKIIFDGVSEVLAQFRPDVCAIEKVFVNVNPQSTLLLGQARGAAIAALTASGQQVFEYTALQVKQAVVGNGHAEKELNRARIRPMRWPARSAMHMAEWVSAATVSANSAARWRLAAGARRGECYEQSGCSPDGTDPGRAGESGKALFAGDSARFPDHRAGRLSARFCQRAGKRFFLAAGGVDAVAGHRHPGWCQCVQ
jgi:crossover junction endodeoxyribonuclease RuvC